MRKVFLYMLAAFMLSSCDNLKKKNSSDTDDEEVTTKKKKKALDDDEATDDDTPKKKKAADDDDDITTKKKTGDDDTADYTDGWTSKDKTDFMSQCTTKAEENVTPARAKVYCNCMLEKIEAKFPSMKDANRMTETQMNAMAAECNQ